MNKEIKEEFDKKFPHKMAEVIDDFGSDLKEEIKDFITQAIKQERERIMEEIGKMKKEKTADRQLYTHDGKVEHIKYFENDSDIGYNQAIEDIIKKIK